MADTSRSNVRRILIVDDDAEVVALLTDLLKEAGYATTVAKTGDDAIAQVSDEKKRPHLVMMDVKLPDKDGLSVLTQLKREHDELEVIVMTAFGGSSTAIKAMEHGAYDYVTKPFEIDDLLATLRRVFDHADLSSEVSALRLELGKQRRGARADRRILEADAGDLQAHRQGRRLRRDRPDHRRERDRQGAGRRGAPSGQSRAIRIRS